MRIEFKPVGNSIDKNEQIAIVDNEASLKEIMVSLGLISENAYHNPDNQEERKYTNSGLWIAYKRKGRLLISVNVGCTCQHDCCGHIYNEEFEIMETNDNWVILRTTSYNY